VIEREWVSIRDPDDDHRRYTFDVSFLLSAYTCIYGDGCRGVRTDGPDHQVGCCEHGAYLNEADDPDELARVVAEELDATTMQLHAVALRDGVLEHDDDGEPHTRTVDGACVFLNRAGFAGGMGCALHRLAERRGEHPMTHKPVVCWQLPLHRTIEEQVANDGATLEVHTIAAFERGHWGDGGADFHWWCLEDPAAFVGRAPVYRSMETELRTMVGDPVYDELAAHLDRRGRRRHVAYLPVV
jgi:hypothetical protein